MDDKILKHLYESYGREIYYYLYTLCRNKSMAEDLLQETFVKALLSLDSQHTNMRAWLYRVGRNLCLNEIKKTGREVLLETNHQQTDEGLEAQILQNERRDILYEAIGHLSGQKQQILQMFYFEGYSLREIAGILEISPENVRILSHRAKKEVKLYIEEADYEI